MSMHTPGPWNTGGTFRPGTPDETQDVWSKAPPGYQSGDQIAQHVRPADARLIAAAPDLLAALRACVEVVKVWHNADDVWDIYYDHSPEMAPVRAAIAKAEGA